MKTRSLLGGAALVAALGFAVPAGGALRTPFLDLLVKQSSGTAKRGLVAFRTLLQHKHKVLRGILQARSTGLRTLVCRFLRDDLRRALILLRRKKVSPQDSLPLLHRNLSAWAKRLGPAVVEALEAYGKPPGIADFFALLGRGDHEAWELIQKVSAGKLKKGATALTAQWQQLGPKLEEALGRFRTWARQKGLEGIRTALYQAVLVLQETRPKLQTVEEAKAPGKETKPSAKEAKPPPKETKPPPKEAKPPPKEAKPPPKETKPPDKDRAPEVPPEVPDVPKDLEPVPVPVPIS